MPCACTRRCRCVGLRVVRQAARRLCRYRTADDGHYKDRQGLRDGEVRVLMGRTGICAASSSHRGCGHMALLQPELQIRCKPHGICRPVLLPLVRPPLGGRLPGASPTSRPEFLDTRHNLLLPFKRPDRSPAMLSRLQCIGARCVTNFPGSNFRAYEPVMPYVGRRGAIISRLPRHNCGRR